MKIAYIGKFSKLWDEEYIAKSLEFLGHTVNRISESSGVETIKADLDWFQPKLVLFAKLQHAHAQDIIDFCQKKGITTASWVFDLYWGYTRQGHLHNPSFKADYVFTTDGGRHEWQAYGIKRHNCVRQGIYKEDCYLDSVPEKIYDLLFVGSFNTGNPKRCAMIDRLSHDFRLKWVGKDNPDEVRGAKLNRLYAESKIVVGDSVYSPHYWSNRVVETLGRGGFLIHQEVDGLKEEYPYLVTYERESYNDLKNKINYYLDHDDEREEIVKKNFEWVKDRYTCEKKCAELLSFINEIQPSLNN